MPRPYVRLRETTFDLYVERDLLPAYHKLVAVLSSWLVLVGYILFAIAFTTQDHDLNATRTLITAVASGLLIGGYLGILAVAVFSRSLLFIIDGVVVPILTASFIGLIITVTNYGLRSEPPTSQIYMSIPLVTACVTTVVSVIILGMAYRELRKIRRRDERRRWHLQLGPYVGNQMDTHTVLPIPGPDDEAQRRQLMRLLHDRGESMSTFGDNNTFRIDLPGEVKHDSSREHSADRGRSPPRGLSLANLVPWKTNNNGTFKDPRERRREEIERLSMQNLGERYRAGQEPHTQTPAWGWPPATRYA